MRYKAPGPGVSARHFCVAPLFYWDEEDTFFWHTHTHTNTACHYSFIYQQFPVSLWVIRPWVLVTLVAIFSRNGKWRGCFTRTRHKPLNTNSGTRALSVILWIIIKHQTRAIIYSALILNTNNPNILMMLCQESVHFIFHNDHQIFR